MRDQRRRTLWDTLHGANRASGALRRSSAVTVVSKRLKEGIRRGDDDWRGIAPNPCRPCQAVPVQTPLCLTQPNSASLIPGNFPGPTSPNNSRHHRPRQQRHLAAATEIHAQHMFFFPRRCPSEYVPPPAVCVVVPLRVRVTHGRRPPCCVMRSLKSRIPVPVVVSRCVKQIAQSDLARLKRQLFVPGSVHRSPYVIVHVVSVSGGFP